MARPKMITDKVVFESLYKDEFIQKEKVSPFSLRCEADFNCIACDLEDVANHMVTEVPSWISNSPTVLLQIRKLQPIRLFLIINSLKSKNNFILMKKSIQMFQKMGKKLRQLPSLTVTYISSVYLITPLSSLRSCKQLTMP